MPYVPMTEYETASEEVRREYDDQIDKHGRITNMKRTLLHNVPSFKAYMEWYTLYDELQPVLGDRALSILSYAVSSGNDCLICGSFFKKILEDGGDAPRLLHRGADLGAVRDDAVPVACERRVAEDDARPRRGGERFAQPRDLVRRDGAVAVVAVADVELAAVREEVAVEPDEPDALKPDLRGDIVFSEKHNTDN